MLGLFGSKETKQSQFYTKEIGSDAKTLDPSHSIFTSNIS